ncbi:MAG: AI-2E family transporter [Chloroflexi bacterium]|nr:AI-2E family transporter [Chloroflexota bacterium]
MGWIVSLISALVFGVVLGRSLRWPTPVGERRSTPESAPPPAAAPRKPAGMTARAETGAALAAGMTARTETGAVLAAEMAAAEMAAGSSSWSGRVPGVLGDATPAIPTGATLPPSGGPVAVPSAALPIVVGRNVGPWRLVVGTIFFVLLVVAAIYFSFRLSDAIVLALVAMLLAVGLQGPVAHLFKLGVPRPLGLLLIYVSIIVGLVLVLWLLVPPVVRDARDFAAQAPTYIAEIQTWLTRLDANIALPQTRELERIILDQFSTDVSSYLGRALTILSFTLSLFGGLLNVFLVLVLSIFMVMEGPTFRSHLLSLLPPGNAQQWGRITERIAVKIQGWLLGTLFLALAVGSIVTVTLLLLGMPYAFLFGFIASVGEFIPMLGPIIAAVPAATIAAFYGWGMFAAVIIAYVVIQQCENYILVPRIMGSTVELPGLVVLVAFLIGTELMGVMGGILAMPVAAIFQVLWLEWAVPAIRAQSGEQVPALLPVSVQDFTAPVDRGATAEASPTPSS